MFKELLHSDVTTAESQDIPHRSSRRRRLYVNFPRFPLLAHWELRRVRARLPDGIRQESFRRSCFYANLKGFLSKFPALARNPKHFTPVIVDRLLLLQSAWSGRQLGPDLVYPTLGTKKRQSGRLARLILEHSRDQQSFELRSARAFPKGINPPCVAIIDLDQVPHSVVKNGYSTQADFHGLMCMLMLIEISGTLLMHVLYLWNQGAIAFLNWGLCISFSYLCCSVPLAYGEGTLTLSRRSETSTPGCATLLDPDFTLVLNGSQCVVEAIAESSFNLSFNSTIWSIRRQSGEEHYEELFYDPTGAFMEGTYRSVLMLCCLLLYPLIPWVTLVALLIPFIAICSDNWPLISQPWSSSKLTLSQRRRIAHRSVYRLSPLLFTFLCFLQDQVTSSMRNVLYWHFGVFVLFLVLCSPFSARHIQDYPIQSTKLLDAIGHPRVRKWQFDTLAAAATFQCLVLCHGTPRPVRNIDILAFLDMLIQDETDIWKAWKKRVADRIVREDDISFTPTIPMFRDERQQKELVDLLDQAQFGYDKYRELYARGVPPDLRIVDGVDDPPTLLALVWSAIRRRV